MRRVITEESKNNQGVSTRADATGWNDLSNELQHKIITHAADDPDAWRANETFTGALRTHGHVRNLADSEALRQYKDNLDGGRLGSDLAAEVLAKRYGIIPI
jgi:hypothetical protein